jgi:hypothetical protein
MKKLLLAFLLLTGINFCSHAQWVSIPDTNFGTWLNTRGYSACLIGNNTAGWQMDTTCPAVVNAVSIYCGYSNITDLTGIQYFDGLDTLDCNDNSLGTLPPLPAGLVYLDCHQTLLTVLPVLPDSLVYLACLMNQLTTLPALPGSLTALLCQYNQLTTLPILPNGLTDLRCSDNQLASIPNFPNGLILLYLFNNRLTSLPTLPSGLRQLDCLHNQLASLPALPNSLDYLNCSDNLLQNLPSLPNNLGYFNVQNNHLTSLPSLPNSVHYFECANNQITSIPELPDTLVICNLAVNPITCLPALKGIKDLYFSNTLVTCLPNYGKVSYSLPALNTLPLCQPGNPNGCPIAADSNCIGFIVQVTSATGGAFPDTLCSNVTGGAPPYLYSWSGNVNGLPNLCFELLSGNFSITVTDSIGCTSSFSTNPLCPNQCVWPGDADYNGIADNNDLLPIGLAYGKVGSARAQQDINWYAHVAQDWIDTITTTGSGSAGINIITVTSSAGISLGMAVSGTGIASGAVVSSIAGGTLALSGINLSAVSGTITFTTPSVSNGTNSKHIDCDGNGIINADDTLAIIQNFSQLHAKTNDRIDGSRMTDPTLYVVLTPDTTHNGDTMYANLTLGDVNLPASNVYGLAFTINYDALVVDSTKTRVTFGNSWLGTASDKISIAKDFYQDGQLKCALTRIDHTTRSGFGQIGQAQFVITTDNINGKNLAYHKMNVWISDLRVIDNLGNLISVNGGYDSSQVEFEPVDVGIANHPQSLIRIVPNPANDQAEVLVPEDLLGGEIRILDVEGRILMKVPLSTTNQKLQTTNLSPGIYFLRVVTGKGMLTKRLVIAR